MKVLTVLIALSILACPGAVRGDRPGKDENKAYETIDPMDPYDYCKKLASDEFGGRLTGDTGYTAAAKWAAWKFGEWGLDPLGAKEGYLQPFRSPYTIVDKAGMTILFQTARPSASKGPAAAVASVPRAWKLEPPGDFMPLLFAANGDTTAGLVFAGWGISAPSLGYDDYAGIDPAGTFVLCFRGTPDPADTAFEYYDQHRVRMRTAKDRGALGIIYIYDKPNAHPNGDWIEGFMPAMISERVADSLFAEEGLALPEIKADLSAGKKPLSHALESRVEYRVASRHFADGIGYNIVGIVEGSDPGLKNECVVIGAHFDHCGSHMGMIFPGADDNASGSAVVMEIAKTFASLETKPKRSIVFALFGGEEEGLVGSSYFAERFPARFTVIAGMFNFDMVGEGDGASCGYTPEPPELLEALQRADARVRTLKSKWPIEHVGVRSSDFAPFFMKGAPCVACFSNGPHLAYHETGDTIYRINPDILAGIARLGFLASYEWANR